MACEKIQRTHDKGDIINSSLERGELFDFLITNFPCDDDIAWNIIKPESWCISDAKIIRLLLPKCVMSDERFNTIISGIDSHELDMIEWMTKQYPEYSLQSAAFNAIIKEMDYNCNHNKLKWFTHTHQEVFQNVPEKNAHDLVSKLFSRSLSASLDKCDCWNKCMECVIEAIGGEKIMQELSKDDCAFVKSFDPNNKYYGKAMHEWLVKRFPDIPIVAIVPRTDGLETF